MSFSITRWSIGVQQWRVRCNECGATERKITDDEVDLFMANHTCINVEA